MSHSFIHSFILVHMIYIWHKPPQDIEQVNLHIKLHIQKDVIINTTCIRPLKLQLNNINKTQNYHRLY
jgi:hypothetical protein